MSSEYQFQTSTPESDVSRISDKPIKTDNRGAIRSNKINEFDMSTFIQNPSNYPTSVGQQNNGVFIYDYYTDYSSFENDIKKERSNLNLFNGTDYKSLKDQMYNKFNRFKIAFPDYHLTKTFAHVFLTRPDLNLFNESSFPDLMPIFSKDPTFYYLYKNDRNTLLSLTKHLTSDHDFFPFLSSNSGSFEISDEFIKTMEVGETFTGYKIQYGKHNVESQTAGTFNISYTDDRDLTIYKIHKAWIEYISKVYRGVVEPKAEYIMEKILDYACSAYYILCGPDGESILFWSKYFGVFPTNTPASVTSWSKGNLLKIPEYNITYAYSVKEDFSPLTLAEFNMNSHGYLNYRKTYEPYLLSTGKTFTGAPFIDTYNSNGEYTFKLRFRN